MPRSKTRALARAARLAEWEGAGEDDSGRTPERVAYGHREIRRRLADLARGEADPAARRRAASRRRDPPDDPDAAPPSR